MVDFWLASWGYRLHFFNIKRKKKLSGFAVLTLELTPDRLNEVSQWLIDTYKEHCKEVGNKLNLPELAVTCWALGNKLIRDSGCVKDDSELVPLYTSVSMGGVDYDSFTINHSNPRRRPVIQALNLLEEYDYKGSLKVGRHHLTLKLDLDSQVNDDS